MNSERNAASLRHRRKTCAYDTGEEWRSMTNRSPRPPSNSSLRGDQVIFAQPSKILNRAKLANRASIVLPCTIPRRDQPVAVNSLALQPVEIFTKRKDFFDPIKRVGQR